MGRTAVVRELWLGSHFLAQSGIFDPGANVSISSRHELSVRVADHGSRFRFGIAVGGCFPLIGSVSTARFRGWDDVEVAGRAEARLWPAQTSLWPSVVRHRGAGGS